MTATLTPPKIHEVVLQLDELDDETVNRLYQELAKMYSEMSVDVDPEPDPATVIMIQIEDDWRQLNRHMSNIAKVYERVTGLECDWEYM